MNRAVTIITILLLFGVTGLSAEESPRHSSGMHAEEDATHTDELLESAVSWWEEERYDLASEALTRIIIRERRNDLAALSREVEDRVGMPLLEWASRARLRAARLASSDGSLRLRRVTREERDALTTLLKIAYEQALSLPVSLPAPPPPKQSISPSSGTSGTSQPADTGPALPRPVALSDRGREERATGRAYVVEQWLEMFDEEPEPDGARARRPRSPREAEGHLRHAIERLDPDADGAKPKRSSVVFDGSREEAHLFAQQVRYAQSLLRERLRYDTELRQRPETRMQVRHELDRLGRLLADVEARAEGAPNREEAERLRFERERMILVHQARMGRQAFIDRLLIGKTLEETGTEPGTVQSQLVQLEGEVTSQQGPDGLQRKLNARVVPAIPPEMLREGAVGALERSTPSTQPAERTNTVGPDTRP